MSTNSDIAKYTPADAGCIIDGHHGHYAYVYLIRMAWAAGMPKGDIESYIVANYERDCHEDAYPHEWLVDTSEEALYWMNENLAPEGYAFDWHDGEVFLWPEADWQADI